jgi:hypothetical protein
VAFVTNLALDLTNYFKNHPYADFVIFGAGFVTFVTPSSPSYPFRIYPIFYSFPVKIIIIKNLRMFLINRGHTDPETSL